VLPGRALRLRLSVFEEALRAAGADPRREYERVGDGPLRDLPAERAARRAERSEFGAWLRGHEVVRRWPGLFGWIDEALRSGRVSAGMRAVVARALEVVAAVPSRAPVQRSVLAAELCGGDPHALDPGTPLHGLVVSLLAAAGGGDGEAGARQVWARWGVLVDPVSSFVLTLGLPSSLGGGAGALVGAAGGRHVLLSYGQLSASKLGWPLGLGCFTCENPSVVIAAEQALAPRCPPLVCTGGFPTEAVRLLLAAVAHAGGEIRHHGDFDAAGVQIFRDLERRYGAVPWRFDVAALARMHGGLSPDVRSLEDAVDALRKPVPEELVIDDLVSDLAAWQVYARAPPVPNLHST
jgi:uncharacterized protein (TIGR02679 family)